VKYVGAFYTDNFKNEANRNDAYTVCDVYAVYELPKVAGVAVTLRGEVDNLFNNLYFSSGEGDRFFPAAERNYILGLTIHL
jgi:outer membrane receptor protein involved in Fe transport